MNDTLRPTRLAALLLLPLLLWPSPAQAQDSCEEVHATCLENCHIDFGMEAKRVDLAKCVQRCDRRQANCADLSQEQRRSQFRLDDPDPTPRRGDPVDVYHYDDRNNRDVRPAPYEEFGDAPPPPRRDEDQARRGGSSEDRARPPERAERGGGDSWAEDGRDDRGAKSSPDKRKAKKRKKVRKASDEPREGKPDDRDESVSDDDWAREE